jgi:hypothetical protein
MREKRANCGLFFGGDYAKQEAILVYDGCIITAGRLVLVYPI